MTRMRPYAWSRADLAAFRPRPGAPSSLCPRVARTLALVAWAALVAACGETTILITSGGTGGRPAAGGGGSGGAGSGGTGGSGGAAPLGLVWSRVGSVDGMVCVRVDEPMSPAEERWDDNYLCTPEDIGLVWSHEGRVPDLHCIHVWDSSDIADGWTDND
jgi:hypothetical protein